MILRQNQAKAFSMSIRYSINNKKHGSAVLFYMSIKCWGCPPQTWTQETFREKFLGTSKTFDRMKLCGRWKILLLTFLIRKVREGGLERSSNCLRKNKKRGVNRVFLVH